MPDWLWQWLPLRWRAIRAVDLDYCRFAGKDYICVYRGRWRRPVEIVATRDQVLMLAGMIRQGEVSDAGRP